MKRAAEIRAQRDELRKAADETGVSEEIAAQAVIAQGLETNYDRKKAYLLRGNAHAFVEAHGVENCGFLTITFPDNVTDPKEAQRRFNNWYSNRVRKAGLFDQYIIVMEAQKRGACHYHLLVNAGCDIRTGFDFESFNGAMTLRSQGRAESAEYKRLTKAYGRSATDHLSNLWSLLRFENYRYGVGMIHLAPLKSNSEAVASYVTKYITKTLCNQGEQFKGARLVRYSQGKWRSHRNGFAWVSESSSSWRENVARAAAAIGAKDWGDLSSMMGVRWAYWLMVYLDSGWEPEAVAVYLLRKHMSAQRFKRKESSRVQLWDLGIPSKDSAKMTSIEADALREMLIIPANGGPSRPKRQLQKGNL